MMLEHPDQILADRYRLLKHLHRGGMSEVFLVFDENTQQQVAIKLVTSGDSDHIKRLQSEMRILTRLSHPHILPLLDSGLTGFSNYLVMPYMKRGCLRDRLAQGKMTPEEAGAILDQLADALQYVHEQGIVHRDIKPSNILLDNCDAAHVYLADFGLAKMPEEGSDITQTGCLIGTPEYMAPELTYMPESVSSDIYSLGILLYQMLTGRRPFTGSTPLAIFWKHIEESPVPPSTLNPHISRAVEQVILQALDKNPQRRFPSTYTMAQAYANALNTSEPSPALSATSVPLLLSAYVTLRKVETGPKTLYTTAFRRKRPGKIMQNAILALAFLLMLTLPFSLGFIFARSGSQVNLPQNISAALGNLVLPPSLTPPPVRAHLSQVSQGLTLSQGPTPIITGNSNHQVNKPGHRHKNRGHGHGHG